MATPDLRPLLAASYLLIIRSCNKGLICNDDETIENNLLGKCHDHYNNNTVRLRLTLVLEEVL